VLSIRKVLKLFTPVIFVDIFIYSREFYAAANTEKKYQFLTLVTTKLII